MSKIHQAFENGKALIGFVTAGDPDLETSGQIILNMAKAGCDLIEIGIPFSDPVAEGVEIQEADLRAFEAGTTTDRVFALTRQLSAKIDIPLAYLTYLNVLFRYGYDKFLQNAKDAGISAVIIPDMPYEEKGELCDIAKKYDIDVISYIAPAGRDRIERIAKDAQGFVCAVASPGVIGTRDDIIIQPEEIAAAVHDCTDIPTVISAGISTAQQAKQYTDHADGIVVDTAVVRLVAEHGKNAPQKVYDYLKTIKDAIR